MNTKFLKIILFSCFVAVAFSAWTMKIFPSVQKIGKGENAVYDFLGKNYSSIEEVEGAILKQYPNFEIEEKPTFDDNEEHQYKQYTIKQKEQNE
uniref:Peptidase S41 n=1 Tax=Parastrongyloides trichosuri TaxID=131310 RepID=A0A0N4ZVW9_PARTI